MLNRNETFIVNYQDRKIRIDFFSHSLFGFPGIFINIVGASQFFQGESISKKFVDSYQNKLHEITSEKPANSAKNNLTSKFRNFYFVFIQFFRIFQNWSLLFGSKKRWIFTLIDGKMAGVTGIDIVDCDLRTLMVRSSDIGQISRLHSLNVRFGEFYVQKKIRAILDILKYLAKVATIAAFMAPLITLPSNGIESYAQLPDFSMFLKETSIIEYESQALLEYIFNAIVFAIYSAIAYALRDIVPKFVFKRIMKKAMREIFKISN